ncbi:hypothetical protein IGI04_019055 [Brassica rapa subsp. trilocularis]|uniref:Uncharacterized protein n=1 Tax=Brassica rapa subsp. trilocularis TaxID=1813537 RepID=A0ABQ7MH53_BRACM|nr:hypothetical protein IGI04_019055 [Brassica rapa subsp. trilocularis]
MAATKMVFHHMVFIFYSFKDRSINFRCICRFFRSGFGYVGFSDIEDFWDDLSDNLPGSLLTESSHMFPFHNRSERFVFNKMVLIFHLDMYFVCSIKVDLYNLPLIFSVFQIWSRF